MEGLSRGFRLLRNALILALAAVIIPLIALGAMDSSEIFSLTLNKFTYTLYQLKALGASSAAIALVSLLFMYRGWTETCFGLDEIFCKVSIVIKYGTIASIILSLIALGMLYPSLQGKEKALESIIASPLNLLSSLAVLAVFLSNVYAFYKLGALLDLNDLKVGAILLVIGPISSLSNLIIISIGLTLIGLILLTVSMNKLIGAEIEIVEEQEKHEEGEYMEPRVGRAPSGDTSSILYDEMETLRSRKRHPTVESRKPLPQISEEEAKLMGPNGFEVKLGPGIRTFGRRDFAGYVSDEDLDYISRRHFEVRGTSRGYFIRDLGSLNGTWVNGRKLERGESVKLTSGAIIDVAEVVRLKLIFNEPEDLGVTSL